MPAGERPPAACSCQSDEEDSDASSSCSDDATPLEGQAEAANEEEEEYLDPPVRPDPGLERARSLSRRAQPPVKERRSVRTQACVAAFCKWMYPLSYSEKSGRPGAPRLEALDAPRWIASIQIVAYHFYAKRYSSKLGWGGNWTQFFFMLSGFILAYAEMAKPKRKDSKISILEYVRKRLVVVYPSYFLSMFAVLCLKDEQDPITKVEWMYLPFHLLLLQSWLPICMTTEVGTKCMPWTWNGESWFMSVLLAFWLFLRPLVSRFRHYSLARCWMVVLLCWAWSLAYVLLYGAVNMTSGSKRGDVLPVWIRATPFGYFHVFVAGVAAARIFILTAMVDSETKEAPVEGQTQRMELDKARVPALLKFGCCLGYVIYALMFFFVPLDPIYYFVHQGGLIPLMLLILLGAAVGVDPLTGGLIPLMLLILLGAAVGVDPLTEWVFKSHPLLTLGRISYLQYLNQRLVWNWMGSNFLATWGQLSIDVAYPFVLVAVAYLMQRWYETPFTEWQRARMEKQVKGWVETVISRVDAHSFSTRGRRIASISLMAALVFGGTLAVYCADPGGGS